MSELQFISNLSAEKLREEVKVEYTKVALDPDKGKLISLLRLFFLSSPCLLQDH